MSKIPVGILGATGIVGQTYAYLLENHPLFEIVALSASPKWDGKTYKEALHGRLHKPLSEKILDLILQPMQPLPVIFSAVGSAVAGPLEFPLAKRGSAVFSHASVHRMVPDIPLIIPEVNGDHLSMIPQQQSKRGWKGFLIVKPNCTLQSFLLPLYPLHRVYGLKQTSVTTMQSTSGAGNDFQLEKNILPYIEGEEEKSETEPLKIIGCSKGQMAFSLHCNRVPVCEGHLACVSASFAKPLDEQSVRKLWESFPGLDLPSAPKKPLHYFDESDRPQPLLDKDVGGGMSIALGRLRKCSIFDLRFTALSHNLIRGAAGGNILTAELAHQKGYLHGKKAFCI